MNHTFSSCLVMLCLDFPEVMQYFSVELSFQFMLSNDDSFSGVFQSCGLQLQDEDSLSFPVVSFVWALRIIE